MKTSLKSLAIVALFVTSFVLSAQTMSNYPMPEKQLSQEEIVSNIEKYIGKVMSDWQIPGMGVAIEKDGKSVLCKGFGVKDLESKAPVNVNTIFQIGSVSKSFTAAVAAQLVDEGLIKWTDKVKDYLPDFKMYDPWVSENLQIQDLTSHRTGLPDDMGTYLGNLGYDRKDIFHMMKYMKPAYLYRGDYQYNNITFIPLALIIEKVTGKSWEENIRERIFKPLGMNASTLNGEGFAECLKNGSAALPYAFERKGDKMDVWPMYGDEQSLWWLTVVGPAGSLCCPPADLIKWARFHLNNGKVGDTQIISEKQMNFLHRGVTITSQNGEKTNLYGHCWFIEQTRKGRLYFHTGTTWGMTTICAWVPELNLAMTVQVNSEAPSEVRHAILRRTIDLYMGLEDYDYNAQYLKEWYERASKRAEAEAKAAAERVAVEAPALDRIAGKYVKNELFGDIDILVEDGKPYIRMHNKKSWKRELKHINGNTYNFRADGWGFDVTFIFEEGTAGSGMKQSTGLKINVGSGEDFAVWHRQGSICSCDNARKPIIGVSGYNDGGSTEVGNTYIKSIRKAGGVPMVIPVTSDDAQIAAVVDDIDALVMTGGEDFDPLKWYGEEPLRALGEIAPERDDFDVKLIRAAVAKGIPVLGICRGEQLMAVAFGGSLIQDIPQQVKESYVKHRQGPTTSGYATHSITVEKGSILEKQLGCTSTSVNSFHHQAIKDVPAGFKVTARSADGIVEAVERVAPLSGYEDGGAMIMGVQFHPEGLIANGGNDLFLGIFKKLIIEAR